MCVRVAGGMGNLTVLSEIYLPVGPARVAGPENSSRCCMVMAGAAGGRRSVLREAWLDNVTAYTDVHVFWVEHGHTRVMVGGELYRLGELEALRIPPGMTVDYIRTTEGSVALSVLIPANSFPDVPSEVVREVLDRDTADVLLHLYSRWKLSDWKGHDPRNPLANLGGSTAQTDAPLVSGSEIPSMTLPPLPDHQAAKKIGQMILDDPSDQRSVAEWARTVGYTARHITERFRVSTGLSFGAWRQRVRTVKAFHLIRQGVPVEDAAEAVGYGSPSSLSAAFHRETGIRPSAIRKTRRNGSGSAAGSSSVEVWSGNTLAGILGAASAIPAADMWTRVNSFHVMIWMVRGSGKLVMGDSVVDLSAGDGVWIPAGVWHRLRMDAGALMVPVGTVPAAVALRRRHIQPSYFSMNRRAELLYRSMVSFTALRPVGETSVNMDDLVPVGVDMGSQGDPVLGRLLDEESFHEVSEKLLAERFGCSQRRFDQRFLNATGQCFEQWVIDRKMLRARTLLANPELSVTEIALRVGYHHGSSFTRAFLGTHNIKPTDYRQAYLDRQSVSIGVE